MPDNYVYRPPEGNWANTRGLRERRLWIEVVGTPAGAANAKSLAGQIGSNYEGTVRGITGLVGYWRCDEASGNLADLSGNANTLTVVGTPTYGVAGALQNDASSTAISLPGDGTRFLNTGTASLDTDDIITMVCWFKRNETGRRQAITAQYPSGCRLEFSVTDHLQATNTANAVAFIVASGTMVDTGVWHMAAVTKNGAARHLYVDGAEVAVGADADQTLSTLATTDFLVGSHNLGVIAWNGSLDEAAVWNVALTATDIANIYAAGITSTFSGSVVKSTGKTLAGIAGSVSGTVGRAVARHLTGVISTLTGAVVSTRGITLAGVLAAGNLTGAVSTTFLHFTAFVKGVVGITKTPASVTATVIRPPSVSVTLDGPKNPTVRVTVPPADVTKD